MQSAWISEILWVEAVAKKKGGGLKHQVLGHSTMQRLERLFGESSQSH